MWILCMSYDAPPSGPTQAPFERIQTWLRANNIHFTIDTDINDDTTMDIHFGDQKSKNVTIVRNHRYLSYQVILYDPRCYSSNLNTNVPPWQRMYEPGNHREKVNVSDVTEKKALEILDGIYQDYRFKIRTWTPEDDATDGPMHLFHRRPRTNTRQWYENLHIGPWEDREQLMEEDPFLHTVLKITDLLHQKILNLELLQMKQHASI